MAYHNVLVSVAFFVVCAANAITTTYARDVEDKRFVVDEESSVLKELLALKAEVEVFKVTAANQHTEVTNAVNGVSQTMADLRKTVSQLQQASNGGSTFVRWGRTVCPNGTDRVYAGYSGGSHYTNSGGAANFVCLTPNPQWSYYEDTVGSGAKMAGVEYEANHGDGGVKFLGSKVFNEDAPCAVCHTQRTAMIMMPGRLDCYSGWNKEYSGYLMSGNTGHSAASEFICVDSHAEVVAGGHTDQNGKLLYLTEGSCGSLKCPPYVNGREITCVVCTK